MIIQRVRPLANDHPEDLASCRWSSRGAGLLQMIIQMIRPLANDHPEGPASCKSLIHKVVGKNYVWYKMFSEFLSIHITLLLAQSHKGANLGNAQKKTFFFRRCSLSYFDDLHLFHLLVQVFSFTISGEKHTHGGLQSSFCADDHRSRTNLLGASRSIEFVLFMSISCTLHVHVLTLISWMNSASGRANIFQQVGPHRQIPYFQITLAGRELIQELALSPLYWLMPDWDWESQAKSGSCVKSFWTKMFWVMWNVQNDWDQQSIIQSDQCRQCECRIMVRLAHPSCLIRCIPQVCQGATGVAPFPQPDQSLPHLLYYQALP